MKALITGILAGFLFIAAAFAADPSPSSRDITHGNVRMVLMSVGQITAHSTNVN
jgi:hypothetical protein